MSLFSLIEIGFFFVQMRSLHWSRTDVSFQKPTAHSTHQMADERCTNEDTRHTYICAEWNVMNLMIYCQSGLALLVGLGLDFSVGYAAPRRPLLKSLRWAYFVCVSRTECVRVCVCVWSVCILSIYQSVELPSFLPALQKRTCGNACVCPLSSPLPSIVQCYFGMRRLICICGCAQGEK